MAKIIVSEVTAPAYWASALVNNDCSGLEDQNPAEAARCRAFVSTLAKDKTSIVSCADESRFTWSYQLYDPGADCQGGDVLDYVTHKRSR